MGRYIAAVLAVALSAAGCSADERVLRQAVDRVAPSGSRHLECWSASGAWGGESPSYTCVSIAPGSRDGVVLGLARRLREDGLTVGCSAAREDVEVVAARRDLTVTATVTPEGSVFVQGGVANVFGPGYRPAGARAIPRGQVALSIRASRATHHDSGLHEPCTRTFLRTIGTSACVRAWNGEPNHGRRSRVVRERPRGPAWVGTPRLPAGAGCLVVLRTAQGYVTSSGAWRGGRIRWTGTIDRQGWPEGFSSFYEPERSNATVRPDGRLTQTRTQRWLPSVS